MQSRDDRNASVDRALGALREADADDAATSPAIEQRLRAEVRRIGRARRLRNVMAAAGVAAAIAIVTGIVLSRTPPPPAPMSASDDSPPPAGEVMTEFLPLIYGSVPSTTGHLVRLDLPRAALASFGLADPAVTGTPRDTIPADVLVGEDGLARAVRFVRADLRQQEKR